MPCSVYLSLMPDGEYLKSLTYPLLSICVVVAFSKYRVRYVLELSWMFSFIMIISLIFLEILKSHKRY